MRKRMIGSINRRAVALVLGLSLVCTGCGSKSAEEVSDYGVSKSTASSAGKSDSTGTASQSTETGTAGSGSGQSTEAAGRKTGELPAVQKGGESIWQDSFNVGNVPVEVNITNVSRDMDSLHSYTMKDIAEDRVNEAETVKAILGDTATEVRRDLSKDAGDSSIIVSTCQSIHSGFTGEGYDEYGRGPVTSWVDAEDYFYHTYEGTYLDVTYELIIAYHRQGAEKTIFLCPKNPGDLVDSPKCDVAEPLENHTEGINTAIWNRVNVWEAMKDRPNRTQSSHEALMDSAKDFAENQLKVPVALDDMKIVSGKEWGDPVQREVFFYSEDEVKAGNVDSAVLDGYEVQYNLLHASGEDGYPWMFGNAGYFWVTDKGVIGCYLTVAFELEEQLAEHVQILEFDNLMESFREVLKNDFDMSKVNGQKLTFDTAVLMYYPMGSEENLHEYTLVPAWAFTAKSNGQVAFVIVNAVDGSKLSIIYTQ